MNFFLENITIFEFVVSSLSLLFSVVLTIIIIFQTYRLDKQQKSFERTNNAQQISIQKKQLSVDTYGYKREIYASAFSVFMMCEFVTNHFKDINLEDRTPEQIKILFELLEKQYLFDLRKIMMDLRESEFLFREDVSSVLLAIRKDLDVFCGSLITPYSISKVLEANINQINISEIVKNNIRVAIEASARIMFHVSFIEASMKSELDIVLANK